MAVRSGLQRFVRILLTSGSGESIWLLAVFLFGALALGITSNFLFGLALSPATVSLPGFGRVGVLVLALVGLAFAAWRLDLRQARSPFTIHTNITEQRAPVHTGLVLLLGPGGVPLAMHAIKHHSPDDGEVRLLHCWALVTPAARDSGVFGTLKERIAELGYAAVLHEVYLEGDTAREAYRGTETVYTESAPHPDIHLLPDQIICDITGGTKQMTTGMVVACLPRGWPIEYILTDRDPITGAFIDGTQRAVVVELDFEARKSSA